MRNVRNVVSLPSPCGENWDSMTPKGNGRHCAQCCKTVVDFTLLSDGEIIDIFKKAKTNPPCGHFLETQLDRELIDTRYRPSFLSVAAKRIAATVILLQSASMAAIAQQVRKATTTQHVGKDKPATAAKRQICGHVLRDETNEPLAGVKVQIRGTQIDTVTDRLGMFILPLPDSFNNAQLVLEGTIAGTTSEMAIEETLNLSDVVNNKELVLYVYKLYPLQQHDVRTYDVREIRTYGGIPVRYVEPIRKKPNIWQRMTRPLRGKKA